jgi:Na+-driven multidrug efflux pump
LTVAHLLRLKEGACRVDIKNLKVSLRETLNIVLLGLPTAFTSALYSLSNLQIQSAINAFGSSAAAGNNASAQVENLIATIVNAIATTTMVAAGQNIGAGNKERTVKVLKTGYLLTSVIMVFFTAAIIGFGRNILWLFIPGETEAIEFAQLRLTFIMSAAICNGVMNVNNAALQAYGFTVGQMISNLIGVCLFRIIWMTLIYPANPEAWLLWLCYPVSWSLTAAIVFCVVIVLTRKYLNGKTFKI